MFFFEFSLFLIKILNLLEFENPPIFNKLKVNHLSSASNLKSANFMANLLVDPVGAKKQKSILYKFTLYSKFLN